MRRSYGFRTFRALEIALYHTLGKLLEPQSTHDFSDEPNLIGTNGKSMDSHIEAGDLERLGTFRS